mgnify:CR=1 FL=1|tara:strand:+ start:733 stop:1593 length:861 start_codon:yes stop_codon:yes gene_type:complete
MNFKTINSKPYFSLILCTLNRNEYVLNFLKSISSSSFKNFEIILVDQNKSNKLKNLISIFENLNIKYLRSDKGLSLGRNKALNEVSGQVVCFPDDDCEYPNDVLQNIYNIFSKKKYDLISVQSRWKDNKISNGNFDKKSGVINKYNIWGKVISYTIFVRSECIKNIFFDEKLGVGSKTIFQSGEESDFVLQVIKNKNIKCYYFADLFIYHPHLSKDFVDVKNRITNYAPGKIYVLRKNNYALLYQAAFILNPLFKSIIYLIFFNKNYYLQYLTFQKRLEGFRKYTI